MNNQPFPQEETGRKTASNGNLCILMLCWEYPPYIVGGLSRHVKGIAVELAKLGHVVHVVTAGKDDLPAEEKMEGVWVHRVKPLNDYTDQFLSYIGGLNVAIVYKAEKLAEKVNFSIIHAHDWLVGAAAIVIKENFSIPLLTTIHATEYGRNNGIYTNMQQFIHQKEDQLIAGSDQLIVCSDFMKEEVTSVFSLSNQKITVIANGIDEQAIDTTPIQMFPSLIGKKFVFSLGRIVPEKGFETLIQAASMAKEKQKNIFFVIGGKGPMLESYRQKIAAQNLEDHIVFIGYLNDEQRNALIQKSEISVFPSLYEPFGIVALESMVLGKPTIVSNTGGLKGLVKHLKTGLLMVPGDPESLLSQIDFLMENPDLAKEIGERGMRFVKSLYSWKRIAAETVVVMEDVLYSFKKTH